MLRRNQRRGFKLKLEQPQPMISNQLVYPFESVDCYHIVRFLFHLHDLKGLKPPRLFRSYLKECSSLLKEASAAEIIKVMLSIKTEKPYGLGLVKKLWQERKRSR